MLRLVQICGLLAALTLGSEDIVRAEPIPADLPRYVLDIRLDPDGRLVTVQQQVTWTNRSKRPTRELVFNAASRYAVPEGEVGLLAKTLEILRMAPSEALSFDGPALDVHKAFQVQTIVPASTLVLPFETKAAEKLDFSFPPENSTSMVVPLRGEVGPGETVTVDLQFVVRLPQKKGRWGQWEGVTTLAQWLPVLAVHDDGGWHPVPFIPWHQPFFNEAGLYSARIALPKDQKLACSAPIRTSTDLGDGWVRLETEPVPLRDFSMIASNRFQEHTGEIDGVKVRCLALPEHAFYGQKSVEFACQAIPVYNQWFGKYPYSQFTIVESFFGWNGNECGGMVMIDSRMFGMPHIGQAYIDYLVSHELCHQWWYNAVGTNGYAETWMDEGLATHFSHKLVNQKLGKNNNLLDYPDGLKWLPNIRREDFRSYGYLGVRARGEDAPTVQEMPKFGHLANLSGITYDRGSRIVGMIEERLGEAAFTDFTKKLYAKYQFKILRVADYQKELEAYTGRSWEDFFHDWLYTKGISDWSVDNVEIEGKCCRWPLVRRHRHRQGPVKTVVTLKQQGEINEPVVLGFRFGKEDCYQLRIPIDPQVVSMNLEEAHARIECWPQDKGCVVRVEIDLPEPPSQIAVDPDHCVLDSCPSNNLWKPECRFRFAPIYTQLEEVDVTNSHDRWNFIGGPWVFFNSYNDPWYARSSMFGFRAGFYKTQDLSGGAFVAYRTNDRNVIAGAEAYKDHWPFPRTQVGINVEKSLFTIGSEDIPVSRAVLYGRYVMMYGTSLYMPPFEYIETFATVQNRGLPVPDITLPGADPFDTRPSLGIHYHKYMLTPYWDPEGGASLDISYQYGFPIFGNDASFQELYARAATVKYFPKWITSLSDGPIMGWLAETRFAFRAEAAAALPKKGQFFTLGGGDHFRGFGLADRQGNLTWVASVEWRLPIAQNLCYDFCDHVGGVRNVYLAPFYDVGNAYLQGQSLGSTAHALGVGLRVDIAWLGLIERTMFRFDVAKTLNADSPWQFWLGFQHPF